METENEDIHGQNDRNKSMELKKKISMAKTMWSNLTR